MNMFASTTIRVAATLAASVALVACGGSDDSSDSPQDDVADLLIQAADDADADVDADCVRDAVGGLSDADATALSEAGLDGDPEISESAGEVLAELLLCEN
ncbi:MAG: hypothetical protein AB8G26_18525 [Ilumatobacter sp.]